MAAQLQYPLLIAVGGIVTAQAFSYQGQLAQVQVLKEPKFRDLIDTAPFFAVCPCEGDGGARFFSDTWDMTYGVQVVLVAAGNLDLQSNLSSWMGWRKQVIDVLKVPSAIVAWDPTITSIWQVEVLPDAPFDLNLLPQGFDVSSVRFRFHSLEDSSAV